MRRALLATLLLAACGSAQRAAVESNGAAPPSLGEADNRIDCRPAGQAAFTRTCTIEWSDGPAGRIATIRKADGGFRRLRATNDGRGVAAADGAEPAHASLAPDQRLEVEIGGDHFRCRRGSGCIDRRADHDRRRDARGRGGGDRRGHAGRGIDGARGQGGGRGDLALCRAAAGARPLRPRQ